MRVLHSPVHEGVQRAITDIFAGGFRADKVIQRQLKLNKRWGSADRRLFAECVYDIVRWWRRLLHVCDFPWPAADRWTDFDRKVLVAIIEAWAGLNEVELGKGVPRGRPVNWRAQWSDKSMPRAVRESLPDWLDRWAFEQLGEKWNDILPVLNTVAPVYLRANRLMINAADLARELAQEKIAARVVEGDAVVLEERKNVFLSRSFKAGHFEVQDLHSQQAALKLAPEPGERVIDACAGAGGKSLHLAALMENKGRVVAMDVSEKKLAQLRERSTRARATCIETRVIDSSKMIKRQEESADRLLLDVPCSGLGVLRRNPDSKWKLSLAEVDRVVTLQREILAEYPRMLKPGGRLVYATCSIVPRENETQVAEFLSQNDTSFELDAQNVYWPEEGGADGFFIAVMTKRS